MNPDPDEYRLAVRARDGDADALEELVERSRGPLFALAYRELCHYDDAQDMVALALCQICRHIDRLQRPERVRAWMHQVLRNEIRQFRRSRRADTLPLNEETAGAASSSTALRLDIERALRRLPRDQARTLALHYIGGWSVSEIAGEMGRPEGTIKRWLHFGRQNLAQEMKEYSPMNLPPDAVILSQSLVPDELQALIEATRSAGFGKVTPLNALPLLKMSGEGDRVEFHLPEELKRCRLFVMEEQFDGRSAFEWLLLLKATAEGKDAVCCMLAERPQESTIFAAWTAGFEMFFTRPVKPPEFERTLSKVRERMPTTE